MQRKQRIPDIHFYEWSVVRWFTSDTRARLDPAGRGIFRDLMDLCYTQGSIPADPDLQARKADCTPEQLRRTWPLIEKHFHHDPHDKNTLVNDAANAYRKSFFRYLNEQKRHGKAGNEVKRRHKSCAVSEMPSDPTRDPTRQEEKIREEKIREDTTTTPPPKLTDSEWPDSTAAVCSEFTTTDSPLMLRIIHAAAAAATNEGLPLTDAILAEAIREARSRTPKQHNAVLYETTVPTVIRNWAREARRRNG